ncbi:hypothetical protein [Paenarthrobacter sp. Y-19]|uniref:hypothetical protein n=1 Tax=Paenarthrobacter sp. Y-19 TaxID=3031125 RepID=UPI0023DAAF68|nr:hypothetical protein [Paenarthrobacter sp. Y-19]
MADENFVTAVDTNGKKRRVPRHYLDNPAFGYKLPPSTRAQEPATPAKARVTEPAKPENTKEIANEKGI